MDYIISQLSSASTCWFYLEVEPKTKEGRVDGEILTPSMQFPSSASKEKHMHAQITLTAEENGRCRKQKIPALSQNQAGTDSWYGKKRNGKMRTGGKMLKGTWTLEFLMFDSFLCLPVKLQTEINKSMCADISPSFHEDSWSGSSVYLKGENLICHVWQVLCQHATIPRS